MTKQKQRGHGEGSIYQRPDGRWVGQITLEDGKRKYLYGKTRKEVADKLHQALQEGAKAGDTGHRAPTEAQ